MSKCYNLICPETKQAIWVGQSQRLYGGDQSLDRLAKWLHSNEGRPIYFVGEGDDMLFQFDYDEWEWADDDDDDSLITASVESGETEIKDFIM